MALALERAIEARLLSALDLARPVLDLGCGDGLFASITFLAKPDVGCDLSWRELRTAQRRNTYGSVVAGTGEHLPFRDSAFGSVISNSTLEHVADVQAVVRELARIVRPAGMVAITVPTDRYQQLFFWSRVLRAARLRRMARMYERTVNAVFRHRHVHSASRWVDLVEREGLHVKRVIPYLSSRVVALDDLLYPLAALSLPWKRLTGSYVAPLGRAGVAAVLARALRSTYVTEVDRLGEGYVLIIAQR